MKRDFRENPKCCFTPKTAMRKFIDCLNEAQIFNEKIPYLVIHQGEKYYSSELEVKLTFKEDIKAICNSKNANEVDNQLAKYFIKKLNKISDYDFDIEFGENRLCIIDMLDKTNSEVYKKYSIFIWFCVFNESHKKGKPITNNCSLVVRTYNTHRISFEIYGE